MHIKFGILIIISMWSCTSFNVENTTVNADNMVVAHRGAWKHKNLPENSIASLRHAIELKCAGSEFDVRMTLDDVLVVNHDAEYNGLAIEESSYADLAKYKLPNGEKLPTLEAFILAGMEDNQSTGLVCEIKPSKSKERGELIAEKVIDLVRVLKAENYISYYISFDYNILKKIIKLNPKAKTQYLNGDKSPKELKADGISGLDYYLSVFMERPQWIQSAKELGLVLNAWTVNKVEDLDLFLANDFDFITTNEPELLIERIAKAPSQNGYKLIWSDEFHYTGKPDSTKWTYDYGFIANNEKQYYTDSLKNARVENGHLIIEAHKEKIANKDYKSTAFANKKWLQYVTKIDTAQYTSARLLTRDLAQWTYGRIEVKAKLPEGVGMWPAIWMLGANRKEVGWPECGEIDIMEHVGYQNDSIFGTIHTEAYNHMIGTQKGKRIFIDQPYDRFHVFALDWTPDKIDFLLDDVVYNHIENEHKTTAEWPFDQDFYLILNVAVGGGLGGKNGIDDGVFPQQMQLDYVRVYQTKE